MRCHPQRCRAAAMASSAGTMRAPMRPKSPEIDQRADGRVVGTFGQFGDRKRVAQDDQRSSGIACHVPGAASLNRLILESPIHVLISQTILAARRSMPARNAAVDTLAGCTSLTDHVVPIVSPPSETRMRPARAVA